MRVFATYNIKGGVGKTTAAVNLSYLSARAGFRTLVWDLDPQGAASFAFRVRAKVKGGGKGLVKGATAVDDVVRGTDFDRLDLLPADFSFRKLDLLLDKTKRPTKRLQRILRPLSRQYDHVYIDCAPSISLLSESLFEVVDALLVPTIPTPLSLRTLVQLMKHLRGGKGHRPVVLPFFAMVDRRKTLHRGVCDYAAEHTPVFLENVVPYSSLVEQMSVRRQPLPVFARRAPATRAFVALWEEIQRRADGDHGAEGAPRKAVRDVLRKLDGSSPG